MIEPSKDDLGSSSRRFNWRILFIFLIGIFLVILMATFIKSPNHVNQIYPIKILTDYKDGVNLCQFTDDGKLLVTLDIELNISCWDSKTWTLIKKIKMPKSVRSLALLPRTHLAAIGGDRMPISIINLDNGKTVKYLKNKTDYADKLSFSRNGASLVSGGVTDTTQVWNPNSGDLIKKLPNSLDTTALAFSPNGKMVARGGFDGRIEIFDTSPEPPVHPSCSPSQYCAFSSRRLVACRTRAERRG